MFLHNIHINFTIWARTFQKVSQGSRSTDRTQLQNTRNLCRYGLSVRETASSCQPVYDTHRSLHTVTPTTMLVNLKPQAISQTENHHFLSIHILSNSSHLLHLRISRHRMIYIRLTTSLTQCYSIVRARANK